MHCKDDGCHNCIHNWFGICEIYDEPCENDLMGVSSCDYKNWELEK